jgi:hypothetical protein
MVRPHYRRRRYLVEASYVRNASTSFVVVAADEELAHGTRFIDDHVGIGTVPDNIAEIGDNVTRRNGSKTSFESVKVGVNIA